MKVCSVEGCVRESESLGMCDLHYQRFKKHGNPLTTKRAANRAGYVDGRGYVRINWAGVRAETLHIAMAEKALGRALKKGECVHHVNENPSDNRPDNLVICGDAKYHQLLHRRAKALAACGNADWMRCLHCGVWGPDVVRSGTNMYHQACRTTYNKQYYVNVLRDRRRAA